MNSEEPVETLEPTLEVDIQEQIKSLQEQVKSLAADSKNKTTLIEKYEADSKVMLSEYEAIAKRHQLLKDNIPMPTTQEDEKKAYFQAVGITDEDISEIGQATADVIFKTRRTK